MKFFTWVIEGKLPTKNVVQQQQRPEIEPVNPASMNMGNLWWIAE